MISPIKSNLRLRILEHLYSHPGAEVYVRELARIIRVDPTNLSRELAKMQTEDVLIVRESGRQKYFSLNKVYIFYAELKSIVAKSVGIEKKLKQVLAEVKGLEICFIYGSYASGKERGGSDIDLFIIGAGIDVDNLLDAITKAERQIGREVNYRLYGKNDLTESKVRQNSFLAGVLKNKKVFIIGDEKDIRKLN